MTSRVLTLLNIPWYRLLNKGSLIINIKNQYSAELSKIKNKKTWKPKQ